MVNGRPALAPPNRLSSLSEDPTDRELLDRFTGAQDETAFETLVQRHGPMVLSVCARVLDRPHDAEDAFQATFLILVRKARSLHNPELLGNWLYGVAYRVARKARAQAARRCQHERQAVPMASADPLREVSWRELRSVLDRELQVLPRKYRAPLVLCYLEGLTNEEAARRLGWPAGSISYRLARGREMLRQRLSQGNRALPAGAFAQLLTEHAGGLAVPAGLLDATIQAGVALAQGAGAGLLPPSAAVVKAGAGGKMAAARFRALLFAALTLGLLLLGTGALAYAALTGGFSMGKTHTDPTPTGEDSPGKVPPCHAQ
jgi:RNA polymerase sigma factor (sigma-70 family)